MGKCKHPEGCTRHAVRGGVCWTHGANMGRGTCSHEGCIKSAQKGGACWTHGTNARKRCSFEGGCTRQAQNGGVCVTHGAKVKLCCFDGCNNQVVKGGVCWTHGAKKSTNPTNTANPPSSSTGANSTSDTTTTTITTEEEEEEEENHGNVGDRGGDKPRPSVTMKTSSKRPTKQRKVDKQITPRKKSRATKRKLAWQMNQKKRANTDGAMTKEVNKPTNHATNNNKPPSALLPNTTMHPVLHQGDGNEIESDESPAAQADDTEDCNTSYDNNVFFNEESDKEGNMNDAMDDDATEGVNQEDATEGVTEEDVMHETTKSTTAAASDLPVGVETQAESAQPPQPQELPTCNHEKCNKNVFREGFCIYHLLAETDKKLVAVNKELEECKKMAETRAAEDKTKLLEAKARAEARAASNRKEIEDYYKNRAAIAKKELEEYMELSGKNIEDYKKRAKNSIDVHKKRATAAKMKLAEATKTVDEYKKRAALDSNELVEVKKKLADYCEGPRQDNADEEETKLRSALSKAIVTENPNVKWDDVGGLEKAKKLLKASIISPIKYPQFFLGVDPIKGILLYGPPGTGKTYLAKAVATEADCTFISTKSSDLISMWQGQSERLVRTLFEMARESPDGQAVIFIDEIDSLCSSRKEGEDDSVRRVKSEFLIQMQGLDTKKGSKVLVLGATNLPWELDDGILRRFEVKVYIPLPDTEARTNMFRILLGDTQNDLSDANFQKLGRETEGFSGSDINVLVKRAKLGPADQCVDLAERQCMREQHFKLVDGYYVPCEKCPHCSSNCRNCQICKARRMQIRSISADKLRTRGVEMRDFVLKNSPV